jgi:hypothetical protein
MFSARQLPELLGTEKLQLFSALIESREYSAHTHTDPRERSICNAADNRYRGIPGFTVASFTAFLLPALTIRCN